MITKASDRSTQFASQCWWRMLDIRAYCFISMVKQRYGEAGNTTKLSLMSLICPMCIMATDTRKVQTILGGTGLPGEVPVLHRVVANIRNGHPEALPSIKCSFQRIHSVSDLTQPTVNLDLSVLLLSIRAEWNLWAVKIHHRETGEIACFAIAGTLKMSPGCSSALSTRASIGASLPPITSVVPERPKTLTQEQQLSSNHRSLSCPEGSTSPDMDEASQQLREHNRCEALTGLNALA